VGLLKVSDQLFLGQLARIRGEALENLRGRTGRVGDLITITDKGGRDFRGRIFTLTPDQGEVFIFETFEGSVEPSLEIHLLQALPKKERIEWIIQKTTELGVSSIVPFESDHSITLGERDALQRKSHRWQGVATKAAQQCRRARVPLLHPVVSFREALDFGGRSDLSFLLWERESRQSMRSALAKSNATIRQVTLVVGPEGGFSAREIDWARRKQYILVGLGARILRTETAAIAAVTIIQYELGDLGGRIEGKRAGQRRKDQG